MITSWQMYWLTKLDELHTLLFDVSLMASVLALVLAIIGVYLRTEFSCDEPEWETGKKLHSFAVPVSMAVWLAAAMACTLTPSTRQMAAIIVIPKVSNGEKVQTVGNKLYDLAVEWMDTLRPNSDTKETTK